MIATGLPASPGAATGKMVFTADGGRESWARPAGAVILVREETSPEDIRGMDAARGIVTARGGMTSHAAVVARGMGRPCVSGAGEIHIDDAGRRVPRARHAPSRPATSITIDGSTGEVLPGEVKMIEPELSGDFATLMGWADERPPPEGARQRRDRRSTPRPPASSAPRASAFAAPSTCSSTRRGSPPCAR